MTDVFSPDERRFLGEHTWAVLATSRLEGAPQQSIRGAMRFPGVSWRIAGSTPARLAGR